MPTPGALALMLAALSMLGPFAIDTYLPAFPNIEAALNTTPIAVQQTLTAYMVSFAVMMLWHGALSDAFGRRNIVLGALFVFAVASLGCAAVHSIEYLWAFRILQGASAGAGIVIGRAIIRDLYPDARATRLLSLVTMIFSIGPAIAPILGGWIVKLLDWRSIFLFIFGYTVVLFAYCFRKLPETLPPEKRRSFTPRALTDSYWRVFTSMLFQLNAGAGAFCFAGLFLYVAAAPVFVTRHLGLDQSEFAWQFIPAVSGIFLGAAVANRLAGRLPVTIHMACAFAVMLGAGIFNVAYHALYPPALPWSVLPLFLYALGFAAAMPVVTIIIMDLFPAMRGLVTSCQAFTQTMLAAFAAGAVAPLLSHSVLWLAAGQLACAVIALVLWFTARAYHHARRTEGRVNAWETVPLD